MKDEYTVIELSGRIDSNNASDEEKRIFGLLEGKKAAGVCFDASGLSYISSAGLRVLMKVKKAFSIDIRVTEVSPEIYDIFEVTGFTELFNVRRKYREISVDGCEIIGEGFYGTVYRLDDDTVVKKYESPEALSMIENEKKLAKLAFVAGIPTAISFDIVKIGNTYGSVFELLKAKTFNDLVKENPEKEDSVIHRYTDMIKLVHGISMPSGTLPSVRKKYIEKLKKLRPVFDDRLYEDLTQYFEKLPEDDHLIHGDIQMKNIMLSGDEPMLIDMDTLSQGIPEFDLGGVYLSYVAFGEDEPDNTMNFFGIDRRLSDKIWKDVIRYYYADKNNDELTGIISRIKVIAYVNFLSIVSEMENNELAKTRIKHAVEHLKELISTAL